VHIAFLGLGLIGGSVARAAATSGFASRVTAWTPDGTGPRAARAASEGIEPAPTAADAIHAADLIVLAAPPLACLDLLDQLAGPLHAVLAADAVITDVASTKGAIVERARAHRLRFVGGHPLAGRETSGYAGSDPELFRDRPWVVVPADPADALAVACVTALAVACGARPVAMGAAEHDAAVAAISHAPLVVAAALAQAMTERPDWPVASGLAAGGWASMTRLALGDPAMGAGILATNGPATAEALRAARSAIEEWLAAIDAGDAETLQARLMAVRERLRPAGELPGRAE
jgi:prephenate dehydrogenase